MYSNLSPNELMDLVLKKDKLLAHKDRVNILGESIEELSEQWKNPIKTISTSVQNLQIKKMLNTLDDITFEEELNNISKNIDFIFQTINNISSFCKDQNYQNVLNLQSTLQKVILLSKRNLESKNIKLIVDFIKDDLFFRGIENEFMQVLLNIINNATDALISKPKDLRNIYITIDTFDNKNIVTIEDSAGGIDEDFITKIFDQYFTTKGDKGSGIGLFMSKQIVEEHLMGEINVKNTAKGACFTITLPKYTFIEEPN
jgi:signal transduction histidine kinase